MKLNLQIANARRVFSENAKKFALQVAQAAKRQKKQKGPQKKQKGPQKKQKGSFFFRAGPMVTPLVIHPAVAWF